MSSIQNRKCFLDPCHGKNVNVSNLQLSRMKLKMKLELQALKKITEEVVHEGDSYSVVVPATVYENPLDTVPIPSHDGIIGCYGTATEEQLKSFFGDNIPFKTVANAKDNSAHPEQVSTVESPIKSEELRSPAADDAHSADLSMDGAPTSCPVDDVELQNAIWNITAPDMSLEQPTPLTHQMNFDDFLMDHTGDDNAGILFDLS